MVYFDNATLSSQKLCQHNNKCTLIAAKQTIKAFHNIYILGVVALYESK